ncbi:hypothetical protein [Aquincola sp. J276]|uniref:hypothetical protein n=1 Tax=Aquincola sp. J276 TaxID=2898432 RepID=UPI00215154E2|nr:hypothetical protein [Aquincola sp. J276]MCR5868098.1 hypothetical protein [Aquincola sp. J276]
MPHFTGQHAHALSNLPCDYEGDYDTLPDGRLQWQASVVAADGGSRQLSGIAQPEPPALTGLQAVLESLHSQIDAQNPADAQRGHGR